MIKGYIYKIEFPNDKLYIGLTTTTLKKREKEHRQCAKSNNNRCLYNAIRKYNMIDTFELIEIDSANSEELLCEKEIFYIKKYKSYYKENGYNMTHGGDGTNGYIFTDYDKKKMSESAKNFHLNNPEVGKKHGELLKIKHQENPELAKERGIKLKQKIKEEPERRQKLSEAQKNFHRNNPTFKEKMAERTREHFNQNPERREIYAKNRREYFSNPENKKQILDKKGLNKPFDIFLEDGTYLTTFNYQFEAVEFLKRNYDIDGNVKISSVLNGSRNSTLGFRFNYFESIKQREEFIRNIKNKSKIKKNLDKLGKNKSFDIFLKDGKYLKTFSYQFEAKIYMKEEHGIKNFDISCLLCGKRKTRNGFTAKYK